MAGRPASAACGTSAAPSRPNERIRSVASGRPAEPVEQRDRDREERHQHDDQHLRAAARTRTRSTNSGAIATIGIVWTGDEQRLDRPPDGAQRSSAIAAPTASDDDTAQPDERLDQRRDEVADRVSRKSHSAPSDARRRRQRRRVDARTARTYASQARTSATATSDERRPQPTPAAVARSVTAGSRS